MTTTFIERNKRKSALAALLFLLREKKLAALLILLVIGASTIFVAPSSFLTDVPGGTRMAAGVAWIASRLGVDVTRWGLSGGRVSFGDLVAAFDAARTGGRAGWGPFFKSPEGKGAQGEGSVAYVKGSREDLADGAGKRALDGNGGAGPFQQVVDPAQAAQDDGAVAVGPGDVGVQHEGFVKAAFAGGFFNGLLGGAGDGANALSGGAYAGKGFFSGSAGAPSSAGGSARNGLANLPAVPIPSAQPQNGIASHISSAYDRSLRAHEIQGEAGAIVLNNGRAYTQLAQGNGQAQLATADCTASNCPGEYAATNSGAIYDGNAVNNAQTNGIVTATPVDGIASPEVPSAAQSAGAIQSANQMSQEAQTCQALDAQYEPVEDAESSAMQQLDQQYASLNCGSANCGGNFSQCQQVLKSLQNECKTYMATRCQHSSQCPLTAANSTCSLNPQQECVINGAMDGALPAGATEQ
jgi:hypothetical protein